MKCDYCEKEAKFAITDAKPSKEFKTVKAKGFTCGECPYKFTIKIK